jgi:stage V sporulation protein G
MKITARIHRIIPNSRKLRAIAEVVLDDSFIIHEVRVVEGERGLFAAMPCYTERGGAYRDYCCPCTAECAADINSAVTAAYKDACKSLVN